MKRVFDSEGEADPESARRYRERRIDLIGSPARGSAWIAKAAAVEEPVHCAESAADFVEALRSPRVPRVRPQAGLAGSQELVDALRGLSSAEPLLALPEIAQWAESGDLDWIQSRLREQVEALDGAPSPVARVVGECCTRLVALDPADESRWQLSLKLLEKLSDADRPVALCRLAGLLATSPLSRLAYSSLAGRLVEYASVDFEHYAVLLPLVLRRGPHTAGAALLAFLNSSSDVQAKLRVAEAAVAESAIYGWVVQPVLRSWLGSESDLHLLLKFGVSPIVSGAQVSAIVTAALGSERPTIRFMAVFRLAELPPVEVTRLVAGCLPDEPDSQIKRALAAADHAWGGRP